MHWAGRVGAYQEEIKCYAGMEWFFKEIDVTITFGEGVSRDNGIALALFMSDPSRNAIVVEDSELAARVTERAEKGFLWTLHSNRGQRDQFTGDIYLQWYHRADFLMRRSTNVTSALI